jgi:hypothetical protein
MARSNVDHFTLLNSWPIIMRYNPWNFNQISGPGAPLSKPGEEVSIQSERDDIADALNQAGELVTEALGFFPRPMWYSESIPLGMGNPYEFQTLRTTHGYLEEFSVRTQTLIQANVAVVYSDANGDGVEETATITVATTVTDADEIRLFFRTADGAVSAGHEDWEIEPVRSITIAAGFATIVADKWLFVDPDTIWATEYTMPGLVTKHYGTTNDAADFVRTVDVYRVYGVTTNAVGIASDPIWEASSSLSGHNIDYGVARIIDARLGLFEARLECTDCEHYYPEAVQVSYKSGYPLRYLHIDRRLELNIIRLANARMPWQPNTVPNHPSLSRWQYDNENVTKNNQFSGLASTPWGGLLIGEVLAWSNLKNMALAHGGKVTARGI